MRSLRSELLTTATVLAIPFGIAAILPWGALGFRATPVRSRVGGFAAFVSLTPEQEAQAMRAAKSSWRGGERAVNQGRADLFFGELPELPNPPVLGIGDRTRTPAPSDVPVGRSPYLPSRAAPAPVRIAPPADGPTLPFPREELLNPQ